MMEIAELAGEYHRSVTIKFNKNYLLKDLDIEGNNKVILEKENFNNYSLKLKEDINYNKLYI